MKRFVLVLAALVVLLWCAPAGADDLVELGAPTLICRSKASYDLAQQLIARGNKAAITKMIAGGRCVVLDKGRILFLEDGHATGVVRVSPLGEAWVGYTELTNYNR